MVSLQPTDTDTALEKIDSPQSTSGHLEEGFLAILIQTSPLRAQNLPLLPARSIGSATWLESRQPVSHSVGGEST